MPLIVNPSYLFRESQREARCSFMDTAKREESS